MNNLIVMAYQKLTL